MGETRIHVPEMYTEPSRFATVIAVGPMRWVPGEWWRSPEDDLYADGDSNLQMNSSGIAYRWLEGYYKPFSVNVGETVVSSRYPKSAQAIIWRGQEFVIVDENEILARVEHGA